MSKEKFINIAGLLFDKDGTLFDFDATWNVWAAGVIRDLSSGDPQIANRLAHEMMYDLTQSKFNPASPIIAGTNREASECVQRALPHLSLEQVEADLSDRAAAAPLVPAVELAPFLDALRGRRLKLGVMTNDAERVAHLHLQAAGVHDRFDFIAGFDSGYGMKPAPDPLLAFANAMDLPPEQIAMVGDSTHDLMAGRAAGMATIGVLTGVATAKDLNAYADVVFTDIGDITRLLQ